MENENYLDFDGAVEFLKTTPSTLYKWLQSGKIKGHKLGRQWRFVKSELEAHLKGEVSLHSQNEELLDLYKYFSKNKITKKSNFDKFDESEITIQKVFEALIFDIQAEFIWRTIHLKPQGGMYGIYLRQEGAGLKLLTEMPSSLFIEFEKFITEIGIKTKKDNHFRFRIYRSESDFIKGTAQILETSFGCSMVLRLIDTQKYIGGAMDKIISNKSHYKEVLSWTEKTHGLIFITGRVGSGKSTTIHGLENIYSKRNLAVYNFSDSTDEYFDEINYVEYKAHDKVDFKNEFLKIMNSDPDVITLTGSFVSIEDEVLTCAYEAARSGHIVIVQMDFEKISEVQKYLDEKSKVLHLREFNELIIGMLSQKLVNRGNGKIAETEIL